MADSTTADGTTGVAAEGPAPSDASPEERRDRALGRALALGLPAVSVAAAIVVGLVFSLGPALLVVASGALLGVIALFWSSLRVLGGDSPVWAELVESSLATRTTDTRGERKKRLLRTIKDLEFEHAVGKIGDADFHALVGELRAEARQLMQEMDEDLSPLRDKAEALARRHLAAVGLDAGGLDTGGLHADGLAGVTAGPSSNAVEQRVSDRRVCSACGASNELDAAFCKACGKGLPSPTATGPTDTEKRDPGDPDREAP